MGEPLLLLVLPFGRPRLRFVEGASESASVEGWADGDSVVP